MIDLYLDLETVAIDDAADYVEPVSAPANYKDESKIAAYIAEKRAEKIAKAALDPDLCRIVALGLDDGQTDPTVTICRTEEAEALALGDLAVVLNAGTHRIITFNGFRFDLPVLMRRAQYLGVELPEISLDKYRSPHVDLYQRLTFNGAIDGHSLRFYARRFRIPCEDTFIGADVAKLVAEGYWAEVEAHCLSDLKLTLALAAKVLR